MHTCIGNVIEGVTGRRGAQWVRDDLSPKDAFAAALATIYVGLDLRRIDLQYDGVHWSSIYACSIVRLRQLDDPGEASLR